MDTQVKTKIEGFFSKYTPATFTKNQIVISPEEKVTSVYFLKKGLVRMYVISEEGEEATIHVFRSGSFFPIMLSLSSRPNKYYFEAVEDMEVVKAPAKEVTEFIKSNPDVLFDLTTRFADAITGLMLRIEQLVSQGAYPKIVSLLLYLADTFGEKTENGILIKLRFSHDQIGAGVGVARETVSRQMEKLEKKDIISQKDHKIIIKDIEKLQETVEK